MLRMIDRHAVHALLKAGRPTKEIALQLGVTQRTIQRIAKEPPIEAADDAEAGVAAPSAAPRCRRRLRSATAGPDRRRSGGAPAGVPAPAPGGRQQLGESTFYRVFRLEKERSPRS
jgi:hypothetical protein